MKLDTTYNLQADTEPLDADKYSKTLQEYHRILWSKPLPNGKMFKLKKDKPTCLLYHKSELGDFVLSSDRAVATFSTWKRLEHIISKVPRDKLKSFINLTDTIGGVTNWPSNRIKNKQTINGARGCNGLIADRLDLTLECIRRYYLKEESPLYETFKRYEDFFRLFEDFKGYGDFFLFQDWVSDDYTSVNIAPPFDNFKSTPVPTTVDEYMQYMGYTVELVKARNRRVVKLGI